MNTPEISTGEPGGNGDQAAEVKTDLVSRLVKTGLSIRESEALLSKHVAHFEMQLEAAVRFNPLVPKHDPKPLKPMPSWIDYCDKEIDDRKFLIGHGFLEPENFVGLIGASYAGKSTLSAQMSVRFAIGDPCFGVKVKRPLRSIFFQAEDSENKLIRISHLCRRMALTPGERQLVAKNTAVVTLQGVQDSDAIAEMERHAEAFKPDVIWVNPLTSFLSKGVYDEVGLNDFIRGSFPEILRKLGCGGVLIQHPPKPSGRNSNEQTIYELQYFGAGMAAITNASRGSLILLPIEGDVFALCGGKGFHELGWESDRIHLRRSLDPEGNMLWEQCEPDQAKEANDKRDRRIGKTNGSSRGKFVSHDQLLKLLRPAEKYSPDKIIQLVKKDLNKGKDWSKAALRELGREGKLAKTEIPNPKGQAFVLYHLPTILEPATEGEDSSEG
jgi:AAA domain-containing protein